MKKVLFLAAIVAATLSAQAQKTPEAIMGACPGTPSWESVADYLIRQNFSTYLDFKSDRNAAIDGYYKTLQKAREDAHKAVNQPANVDNTAAQKRAAQLKKQETSRQNAGAKFQSFFSSLTPEQQRTLANCKSEEESMRAIQKMGKWEEFSALMSGTETPSDNAGLTKEEQKWLTMDLSGEKSRAYGKIADAIAAKNKIKMEYREAYEKAMEKTFKPLISDIIDALEGEAFGKGSGNSAASKANLKRELDAFYAKWAPRYLQAHTAVLDAMRAALVVDEKVDKQADINNRMAGLGPLPPIGRATYSRAIEYVQEAYDILLGENWKAPEE